MIHVRFFNTSGENIFLKKGNDMTEKQNRRFEVRFELILSEFEAVFNSLLINI